MLAAFLQPDVPAELAVDEDGIPDGENHAERPPYEADAQSVSAGGRVVNRQAEIGAGARANNKL